MRKALVWSQQFDHISYFDDNGITFPHGAIKPMLACGAHQVLPFPSGSNSFNILREAWDKTGDWLIGYLGYDLKNEIENLIKSRGAENQDQGYYGNAVTRDSEEKYHH